MIERTQNKKQDTGNAAAANGGKNGITFSPPDLQLKEQPHDPLPVLQQHAPVQGVFKVKNGKNYTSASDLKSNSVWKKQTEPVQGQLITMAEDSTDYGELRWAELIKKAEALTGNQPKRKLDKDESDDENEDETSEENEKEEIVIKHKKSKKTIISPADMSLREMFIQVLNEYGISDLQVQSIVTDINPEEYTRSGAKSLLNYDLKGIASCFTSSANLLNLLGDQDKTGKEKFDDKTTLENGLPLLLNDIKKNEKGAFIYRIGIGGMSHSFTITVRNNTAELLQSFAGASGETLMENINKKGSFGIDEICDLLGKLTDTKKGFNAMNTLFGGPIDVERAPRNNQELILEYKSKYKMAPKQDQDDKDNIIFYRDMKKEIFQVERRELFPDNVLLENIKERIKANLKLLGIKLKK